MTSNEMSGVFDNYGQSVQWAIDDARRHFDGGVLVDVQAWLQGWGDTSCGHGGPAGQKFTDAVVVAVTVLRPDVPSSRVLVYSAGRLLHDVPENEFLRHFGREPLPRRGRWADIDRMKAAVEKAAARMCAALEDADGR